MTGWLPHRFGCVASVVLLVVSGGIYAAPTQVEIGRDARNGLEMTVYNANFAVVRDHREIVMPLGEINLEFSGVATAIQPQTVSIVSGDKNGFVARQQNYRFDLINRQILLERFVGRKLKYSRSLLENGNFEKVLREGILLSIDPEIVKFGDVIEVGPEGTISLPYLPDDLKTTPTLVFLGVNNKQGKQDIDVRYHTDGIGWEADYALTLPSDKSTGKDAALSGWVTIHNRSGSDYDVNQMRMVAGQVITTRRNDMPMAEMAMMKSSAADGFMPQTSNMADYHLYEYPLSVRVPKNDVTQLHLISVEGIAYKRSYRLESQVQPYASQGSNKQPVSVWIEFFNAEKNSLGVPLPSGTMRVYEKDRKGSVEFIGESHIGHTAVEKSVAISVGESFDLSAERIQTTWRRLGDRSAEIGYRIVLQNARDETATIEIEEKLSGDWLMIQESQKGQRVDATTQRYLVKVDAKGEATLEYLARMNW